MAKAVSQAQLQFMERVKNFKLTGEMPAGIPWERQQQVRKAAEGMSHEDLNDYLTTKTDELPGHIGEE